MLFGKLLLVYQMPKSGSQTVESTLRSCGLPHQILRFHYLSAEQAEEVRRGPQQNASPERWQAAAAGILREMSQLNRLIRTRRWLRRLLLVPPLEVISAVREPIGSALSSIFENHGFFFPQNEAITPEGCAQIVQRPKLMGTYQNWLERETKAVLGIDVYARDFPITKGWSIYENHFARLLLYRFEFLDQLPAMLQEFLGCTVTAIVNANLGTSKAYASLYADVKKQLRLPPQFVRAQYGSKMMQHFYSPAELESLTSRWAGSDAHSPAALSASAPDR